MQQVKYTLSKFDYSGIIYVMKKINKKNAKMKAIENREGVSIEELLRIKFVDENKSIQNIANELQISYVTTIRWLKLAGIYSRMLKV